MRFKGVLSKFPHVKQMLSVLGITLALFGMYKLYRWVSPEPAKKQSEGFLSKGSAEQKWLYQNFDTVHRHYMEQRPITQQDAKDWADETQEVYEMYKDLKEQGQDFERMDPTLYWKFRSRRLKQFESGGGPSGDSRTMKKAMARVIRREDQMVLTEKHEGLEEDGKRYTHCHDCIKCGSVFFPHA